jgi:hypothetical protein
MSTTDTTTENTEQTTADRLEAKRAEQSELRLMADMYEAGFENVDDYNAWKELEKLRKLTKELRSPEPSPVPVPGPPRPRRRDVFITDPHFPLAG